MASSPQPPNDPKLIKIEKQSEEAEKIVLALISGFKKWILTLKPINEIIVWQPNQQESQEIQRVKHEVKEYLLTSISKIDFEFIKYWAFHVKKNKNNSVDSFSTLCSDLKIDPKSITLIDVQKWTEYFNAFQMCFIFKD